MYQDAENPEEGGAHFTLWLEGERGQGFVRAGPWETSGILPAEQEAVHLAEGRAE